MKLKQRCVFVLVGMGVLSCLYVTAVVLQFVLDNDLVRDYSATMRVAGHLMVKRQRLDTILNFTSRRRSVPSDDVTEMPYERTTVDLEGRKDFVPKRTPPPLQSTILSASKESLVYKQIKPISIEDAMAIRRKLNSHRKAKRRKGERLAIYKITPGYVYQIVAGKIIFLYLARDWRYLGRFR